MKKMILIVGLILLIGVIFSGCAGKQKQGVGQPTPSVSPEQQTKLQNASKDVSTNISINQAELDKLKADLEKLETEDLGGLSED